MGNAPLAPNIFAMGYPMKMYLLIAWCYFAIALSCTAAESRVDNKCASLIPKQLAARLSERYAKWNVVSLKSLENDDRNAWSRKYPSECPGVVKGNYDGTERHQFMILLNSKNKPESAQLIFAVKTGQGNDYSFERISLWPLYYSSVIVHLPHGKYHDFYEPEHEYQVDTDLVSLGNTSGDKTRGYFFLDGEIRSIFLRD